MKPKDLKTAFKWEERIPILKERVFHVPEYFFQHEKYPLPSFAVLFGNEHPVHLEYCCGNGDWIVGRAKRFPQLNWVGVERRFDRVQKIWSKMKNAGLSNLLIVCGEAKTFTDHYLAAASVQEMYINFPDPWPKRKHAKHRLMAPPFIDSMARVLRPQGEVYFVTDDVPYLENTVAIFGESLRYTTYFPSPGYSQEVTDYGASWFDSLWREQGRTIYYGRFIRNKIL